jgi:hypothetical protein
MMDKTMDDRKRTPETNDLVEAALRSQPLAVTPPGLAAAVLQRLPAARPQPGLPWQVIALALVLSASLVTAILWLLRSGLALLATPERLLRLQFEWWYWQQRAGLAWAEVFGRFPPLEQFAPGLFWWGVALLFLLGGAGLLLAGLGGWLQLRAPASVPRT